MKFLRRLITNHPLANIAFAVVLLMGILSYRAMPREQDPEINFNWVNVTTALPGASAEDVEKRITEPLEDAVRRVADIKFVSSSSRENVSSILVRFRDVPERVFDKRINDLRREVQNAANSELPEEAKDPFIVEITTSNGFPTAMLLVTAPADDETLRYKARELKEDIERLNGVDTVGASGLHDPELQVRFHPERLAARGLSAAEVADGVRAWFRDTFAGKARVGQDEWLVRMVGQNADPDYVGRLHIQKRQSINQVGSQAGNQAGATQTPLDSVATISRDHATPRQLVTHNGLPAILLTVNKKSYTNTIDLVNRINQYIDDKNKTLAGSGVRVLLMDDQTIPTQRAIGVMEKNAIQGLLLILLVCWIFLGTRISLLVALGIPFSLAGAFWLLHSMSFTLNVSVLLGIVIVLGMLVDDAVVVVEEMYYRITRGAQTLDAAVAAIGAVGAPVLASVLTTMAAFLPLMLLPGILGKFMFVIPLVVTLALMISLVEAYWMLPAHVTALNVRFDRPSRFQPMRVKFTHWLRVKYSRLLIRVMRRPKTSLSVIFGLMLFAVVALGSGWIKLQFFAFDPIRLFYVNVEMPAGSAIDTTLKEVQRVEAVVQRHLQPGEVRAVAAVAGIKFTDTEPLQGDTYGQVTVALRPKIESTRDTSEIVEAMRHDVEAIQSRGKISFLQISGGPPVTKPIRIRVRGEEQRELRRAADALKALVQKVPGTRDVVDDEVAGREQLVLTLDAPAIKHAGLDVATVSRLVRLHVDGEIVAEMRDRGDKLEVRVRAARSALSDITQLLDDPIALPGGGSTTLGALVQATTRSGHGIIKHHNLRRAITVEADLDQDKNDTLSANQQVRAEWEKIRARFPNSDLDFSGELDDIEESIAAMKGLFLLGVGLIYLILAAQFRSYWQPLMILGTVPMAFTGVMLGLLITQNPLSLYTLYGVIALTGIAVNSAIVLIDAANQRRASGMSVLHASIYAARRRLIPILITSATTIAGLSSLALGLGGKSLIWGPVASSIVWGLGIATILTLFVMPLIYRLAMGRGGRK